MGKTTLIEMIGKLLGKRVIRVNLSEHTDMIDLLGSEYPSSKQGEMFKWMDGALLDAIKNGHWFLLDEMNLAQ